MLTTPSLKRHRRELERREEPYLRRFYFGAGDDYPYRSHGQPLVAYIGLTGCLFILIVTNGASLWIKFRPQPFLSAYLAVSICSACMNTLRLLTNDAADFVDGLASLLVDFVGYNQMVQG